ncbi:MAG: DUF3592 domain-containing protein [Ruminococcus sp.]|nr:DUF3592 domain-containing protein [Ruminococcus sp.]MCM1381099.1 DUF3592 domain-containing protein [Muribaculaceae bacterium]MCM1478691.1 DUF3592 domain-containing protein [Muribaculaceae bacterium]
MRKKIFSALIFIVFFGGLAGAIAFRNTDPRVMLIFAGGIFFFVGLLGAFVQKFTPRTAPILILSVFGAPMAGIPLWLVLADKYPDSIKKPTEGDVLTVVGFVLIIVGIGVTVFALLSDLYSRKICTMSAAAKCAEVKTSLASGKHGMKTVYFPVWEFEYLGSTYTVRETDGSDVPPEVGDETEIFFNPRNPEEIYRKIKGTVLAAAIFGVIFVILGIALCLVASTY